MPTLLLLFKKVYRRYMYIPLVFSVPFYYVGGKRVHSAIPLHDSLRYYGICFIACHAIFEFQFF